MSYQRIIEDYDDYYDVCQNLNINPVGIVDDNFYEHWNELEVNRHKLIVSEGEIERISRPSGWRHTNV